MKWDIDADGDSLINGLDTDQDADGMPDWWDQDEGNDGLLDVNDLEDGRNHEPHTVWNDCWTIRLRIHLWLCICNRLSHAINLEQTLISALHTLPDLTGTLTKEMAERYREEQIGHANPVHKAAVGTMTLVATGMLKVQFLTLRCRTTETHSSHGWDC